MTDDVYEILTNNSSFEVTREQLEKILDVAENLGYYDGEYTNNPASLIAFIDGYLSK